MADLKYPKLFEPLALGPVVLKNRFVMGSMHTGLEDSLKNIDKLAAYYEERAKGGVGMIVTGGYSPNRAGWLLPFASKLTNRNEAKAHQTITKAVRQHGTALILQILHSGRYAYHPWAVAPSPIKSPISMFKPWELSERRIHSTIEDYVQTAALAHEAGYDGVEVMGSEGYLINQFVSPRTNLRKDAWGGALENRCRFPVEIVKRIRQSLGPKFVVIFRISLLDLVEKGSLFEDVIYLAKAIERAGASILSTGIGWHESRVPTIATDVPRAAFTWTTKRLKQHIHIPIITANRINTPEVAEKILENQEADLISMARPFLADPHFVVKSQAGKANEINTCIACNQGCLDHIFARKRATCLVNPRACYETELVYQNTSIKKKVAVVGAGPAGLSFSVVAAARGHRVTLFEAASFIGGQFNLAKRIPGKQEFEETLRYYEKQIELLGINLILNKKVGEAELFGENFDEVIIATGIKPRKPSIPGIEHSKVVMYTDLISGKVQPQKKIAIIGAGGIGFDTAKFILGEPNTKEDFFKTWGVDTSLNSAGGLVSKESQASDKIIYLLQRKKGAFGKNLGKTTGWIHRTYLRDRGVKMLGGVEYLKISDSGLHILHKGKEQILDVDQIIICAGQESLVEISNENSSIPAHLIGGAFKALELDAKEAIKQGALLAATL